MKTYHLIFGLALLMISACGNSKETATSDKVTKTAVLADNLDEYRSASTNIEKVSIDENVMTLIVSYSGGCEKHEFSLVGSTALMKSLPPKRNILLQHKNNDDNCREYITDTLQFDITPLGYKKGEEVHLILDGYKDPIHYTLK
ncbi:hypothetical protein K6119_04725 [Paracrocinitomix mangrovi]|uniref:hypothetical protein n=1 Tax=Paracrocinitomix mangrovi TaxID=2862509 RepID=UPI001C8E6435|nr:hypothetical protein [Paracrocinitomix mangrovi]UKN02820.1 hypothetical protein K6119_04725 [Paracrocinitomix mangrovi]